MQFGVCPHDTSKNLIAWINLSAYLGKQIKQHFTFDNCLDFKQFYQDVFDTVDIAYVNPMDALTLFEERGYMPLCGTDLFDETIFVVSNEISNPSLNDFSNQNVFCVDRQFATYLGLYELNQHNIVPKALEYTASWLKVISGLAKGQFHYGILYSDFHSQLSSLSRQYFQTVHSTENKTVSHIFMLHSKHAEYYDALVTALFDMQKSEEGRALMKDLRIENWRPIKGLETIKNIITVAQTVLTK